MNPPYHRKSIYTLCFLSLATFTLLVACSNGLDEQPSAAELGVTAGYALGWDAPPMGQGSETITLSKTGSDQCNPNPKQCVIELENKDYHIKLPANTRFERGLSLVGGRNIKIIGGEVWIPTQLNTNEPSCDLGDDDAKEDDFCPSIESRTALKIKNSTGIVHIEGVLMRGPDISEGIQIDAPKATVQLQNIRIADLHARDNVNFTDNHPDLIQTYGNVKTLRVKTFTGVSNYQGLLLKADLNKDDGHGPIVLRRVNIVGSGGTNQRPLLWIQPNAKSKSVTLDQVFVNTEETFREALYPNDKTGKNKLTIFTDSRTKAEWRDPNMTPPIAGPVTEGYPTLSSSNRAFNFVEAPEAGDTHVGINYVSPSKP